MYNAQQYAAAKGRESARVDTTVAIKSWFFDRKVVQDFVDRKTLQAIKKSSLLIRKIATRSMRPRKSASSPGQPPSAHGERGALLKKMLFASFDPTTLSGVVGPTLLQRRDGRKIASDLESGARVRRKNPRRRIRQVGGGGESRIGGPACQTTHDRIPWPGYNQGKSVAVTYVKLRSAKQAERANELNALLYGPAIIEGTIAPRPFMGPALVAAAPELPTFYGQ